VYQAGFFDAAAYKNRALRAYAASLRYERSRLIGKMDQAECEIRCRNFIH